MKRFYTWRWWWGSITLMHDWHSSHFGVIGFCTGYANSLYYFNVVLFGVNLTIDIWTASRSRRAARGVE